MSPAADSQTIALSAPLSGMVVPLDDVPDPVFAQRLVGDGVSIDPLSQELVAPCDARVVQIHRAGHALTLGIGTIEVLIHIGLDTVSLNGQGFTPRVKNGDRVRRGDPLITFDADFVATHARSLLTQIVVTNMESVAALDSCSGQVVAGRDVVLRIKLAAGAVVPAQPQKGEVVESAPILIESATGLHARPAAVLAAAARRFTADVRLIKDDRDANARSVVSIMALEVAGGDTVRIVARGQDAAAAVATLSHTLAEDLGSAHEAATVLVPNARERSHPAGGAAPDSRVLRGVPASPGLAFGRVHLLSHDDTVVEERAADANHERRALDAAIASAHLQLEALQGRLSVEADPDRAAIFAAHQELLEDPEVLDAAAEQIRAGASAAYAWREAYREQADRLLALRNPLLAARATDLRDIGRRVLHLLIGKEEAPHEVPPESIVIAEDLAPSDVASLDRTRVRGVCTTMGSATSHVAILARALGIPALAAVDPRALELTTGTPVVLDGDAGTLQPEPSAQEVEALKRRQQEVEQQRATELAAAPQAAVTTDGHRVEVVANIGDEAEAQQIAVVGAEGVGLLRTEFLFQDRRTAPTEAEQADTYAAIARALGRDRILVIRTLDVGGDKPLAYMPGVAEANPFLGERGIRLLLSKPEILRTQVRAILKAAPAGRIAIMFPMISTLAEWRAARAIVEQERADLGAEPVQIGIMVETAAAALMADHFAREADFFSIGTNDLTQYTLAMDRTNPRLAAQVDALHPAVLRLIERTVAGAHSHDRWVGVCGAVAADPKAVPILVGLGVDELSVPVPSVPAVKARIRKLSLAYCRSIAQQALACPDAAAVRALVTAT